MATEIFDPNRQYAAPAGAHLTYRGGPLLKSAKLFGVFVDATSDGGSDFQFAQQMNDYLKWLVTSDVLAELAEYNTGLGSYLGNATIPLSGSTPPPPPPQDCNAILQQWLNCINGQSGGSSSLELPHRFVLDFSPIQVTDTDIQNLLTTNIRSGELPQPDSETLYVMFFPSGVSIQYDSQDASCQQFCGYHSNFSIGGSPVYYAVLPFPDCPGCLGGLQAFDVLTATASHEVCEAITDPAPGSGWYDDTNGEIGDICAWQFRQDGQYNVQLEWSNRHNACI